MNLKKQININKKLIIFLLIINIVIICSNYSYALFQTTIIKNDIVKLESGNPNITTTTDYTNNIITLAGGESKTINVTLSNITDYNILYKMYYTIENGTGSVFATSATDNPSGVMKTEKSLTITLQNNGASSITIRIGTKGDLINSEITLESNQYEITLDNEGPVITTSIASSSKGNNNWYNLLSIKGEAVDERSTVSSISSCITTNTSCTPNSSTSSTTKTVSISTSNSSSQRVCFQATDSVGNQSEITCSEAYKVDIDSPSVTNLSDAGSGKVTFTATDIHSGPYQYCVNKSSTSTTGCTWYTASSGAQTTGAIITENNTFYVHLKDNAGNIKHSSAVSVKYDNTGPTVAVSVASSTAGVSSWYSAISIKGTATDDKSSVSTIKSCLTTDTTCTPNSSTSGATATVAITGSNTTARRVCFNATDSFGNTGATQCSSAYKVDQTAPSVTNVSDAGGGKITFTASDSHSGVYQYCVNQNATSTTGCSWKTASSGTQTTGEIVTEDGNYYVHVRDKAYKVGHSSAQEISICPNCLGKYLLANALSGKTARSGLYRYVGENVNNYVSVGGVLYRVIGVTDGSTSNTNLGLVANQVKVIKASSLGSRYMHSNSSVDARWNVSGYPIVELYTFLQSGSVLGSSSVIPSAWVDKISSVYWSVSFGDTMQSTAKVGLMYREDLGYSYKDEGANCYSGSSECPSWLRSPNSYEWTMTFSGQNSGSRKYGAYFVMSSGTWNSDRFDTYRFVRPVFFLNADVVYTGEGDGSSGSPYQIQ